MSDPNEEQLWHDMINKADWNEELHPRDDRGRFSSVGGSGSPAPKKVRARDIHSKSLEIGHEFELDDGLRVRVTGKPTKREGSSGYNIPIEAVDGSVSGHYEASRGESLNVRNHGIHNQPKPKEPERGDAYEEEGGDTSFGFGAEPETPKPQTSAPSSGRGGSDKDDKTILDDWQANNEDPGFQNLKDMASGLSKPHQESLLAIGDEFGGGGHFTKDQLGDALTHYYHRESGKQLSLASAKGQASKSIGHFLNAPIPLVQAVGSDKLDLKGKERYTLTEHGERLRAGLRLIAQDKSAEDLLDRQIRELESRGVKYEQHEGTHDEGGDTSFDFGHNKK